jgi:beta-lactamase class A
MFPHSLPDVRRRPAARAALLLVALCVPAFASRAQAQAAAAPPTDVTASAVATVPALTPAERLERELARISDSSGGVLGVGAVHIESGRSVFLHGDVAFPQASSYKVPIAVELLTRVDRGELRLDSMVALAPPDVSPGSGTLSQLYQVPGIALSVRNLLELMLLISDNSATDKTLELAGGAHAVTARMRALGLDDIRVDRSTLHLIAAFVGVEVAADERVEPAQYRELVRTLTPEQRQQAAQAFAADPRDTATPADMTALLVRIAERRVVSDASTDLLLDIMTRSTTGRERILGMLPPGTSVAHKTGTIGGTTNDVGIVRLPHDAGTVALALFVKDSALPVAQRERAIAHAARAVYDYFLFTP